jgi:two-component system response regulator HydG
MKMGAFDYIAKPFKHEEILHRVNKAINHSQTAKEMSGLQQREGDKNAFPIVGRSKTVLDLIERVKKIAAIDLPVLITGETGTGKSLVAKTIHSLSRRAAWPYIALNCAAVPELLLESELFGHVKGAFTGAILDRKGLFEAADGGSLLLDEIGCMPYPLQAKLLDILQENQIRPVGSNRTKKVNARVITATNANLEQAIGDRTFREDLYYRIKVAHIHLPPLREHLEDVMVLAGHFLSFFIKEFNKPDLHFSDDALEFLKQYNYPGNVRELYNLISSAAAIASEPMLTRDDFCIGISNRMFDVSGASFGRREEDAAVTLEEKERVLIEQSIKKHSHNLVEVCRELDISRTTLWRRMKKYDLTK